MRTQQASDWVAGYAATQYGVRKIMSLREVLIDELKDLYSAENQQVKAMPKAVRSAETDELKQIFTTSLEQTKGQVERLKQVFEHIGKKATGKHCSGMEGAIDEVKEALEEDEEGAVFDAGLIGAALRVEHYEIAGYTAAVMMAKAIGEKEIVDLLTQTLNEEQATGKQLTSAGKNIFKQALAEEGNEDEPEKKPKDAKERKSEKESEQDERDAQAVMDKEETGEEPRAKKAQKKKK